MGCSFLPRLAMTVATAHLIDGPRKVADENSGAPFGLGLGLAVASVPSRLLKRHHDLQPTPAQLLPVHLLQCGVHVLDQAISTGIVKHY